jgi:hypothetical protein
MQVHCAYTLAAQQPGLLRFSAMISPRKHRIMPLQAHRVNATHLGTTRRGEKPTRSVGHVVHTACWAQCVCKYNCFSRWMNHPPRTMRLERPSWAPRGRQIPSNQNPVFASPGGGCRARSDASLPCIKRNCVTAYYRVCIRPAVSVWKRGGTFDSLCDYCATKFRYFSVRLAQTVSRCPKGYNSEG